MVDEGIFPKTDGSVLYASEINDFYNDDNSINPFHFGGFTDGDDCTELYVKITDATTQDTFLEFTGNSTIEWYGRTNTIDNAVVGFGFYADGDNYAAFEKDNADFVCISKKTGTAEESTTVVGATWESNTKFKIVKDTSQTLFYADDILVATHSTSYCTGTVKFRCYSGGGGSYVYIKTIQCRLTQP